MHILMVTTTSPTMDADRRLLTWLSELAPRQRLTLLCLCHGAAELSLAASLRALGIRVVPVYEERAEARRRALTAAVRGEMPIAVAWAASPALRMAALREIARERVDVVHADGIAAVPTVLDLPVPLVWDAEECASWRLRLRAQAAPIGLRAVLEREAARTQIYERRVIGRFARVLVAHERDRVLLRAPAYESLELDAAGPRSWLANPRRPLVLPMSVAVEASALDAAQDRAQPRAVICAESDGSAAPWLPPLLAALWRGQPDLAVTILGGVRALGSYGSLSADRRVRVAPETDDPREHLAGATLAICPKPGMSTHSRVALAAMAQAVPLVTTYAAVAGLRAVPGRHLLIGARPETLARQALLLLADRDEQARLGRAGQRYVRLHHRPDLLASRLERLYADVCGYTIPAQVMPEPVVPGGALHLSMISQPSRASTAPSRSSEASAPAVQRREPALVGAAVRSHSATPWDPASGGPRTGWRR